MGLGKSQFKNIGGIYYKDRKDALCEQTPIGQINRGRPMDT